MYHVHNIKAKSFRSMKISICAFIARKQNISKRHTGLNPAYATTLS